MVRDTRWVTPNLDALATLFFLPDDAVFIAELLGIGLAVRTCAAFPGGGAVHHRRIGVALAVLHPDAVL